MMYHYMKMFVQIAIVPPPVVLVLASGEPVVAEPVISIETRHIHIISLPLYAFITDFPAVCGKYDSGSIGVIFPVRAFELLFLICNEFQFLFTQVEKARDAAGAGHFL